MKMAQGITAEPDAQTLLHSPASSHWLKSAIQELERRDPLDALSDVRQLLLLQEQRWSVLIEHLATPRANSKGPAE